MTLGEFWRKQQFAYLATYSFNRGPKLTEEIQQTKQALQTARYMQQPALQQKLYNLEHTTGKLTDALASIHLTAVLLNRIVVDSKPAQQLATICVQAGKQEVYAGCRPIYRDALAFYDRQDKLLQVLNICFECHDMSTDTNAYVEADLATYQALRNLLSSLGHPIETS